MTTPTARGLSIATQFWAERPPGQRRVDRRDSYGTMVRVDRERASIRSRSDADLAPLVDALALVATADGYPSHWPSDPVSWLRCTDRLGAWVAERSIDLLGHVVLRRPRGEVPVTLWCAATGQPQSHCAVVVRLFVVPYARGRGLGRTLIAAACAEAAGRGLHPVLDVVDTNRAAVRLYERLGWTRLGTYEQTFHDDGPAELLHCFAAPG